MKPGHLPKLYDGYKGLFWSATVDHRVPFEHGGRHTFPVTRLKTKPEHHPNFNLVLACGWGNSRKGSMTEEEFMQSEMLAWRRLFLCNLDRRLAEKGMRQEDVTIVDLLKILWDDKSYAYRRTRPDKLPSC